MSHQLVATYYRVALLLGLVNGDAVHEWATQVIECEANPGRDIIDLALVSTSDLTELRHALWTMGVEPEPLEVIRAVLGAAQSDVATGRRSMSDTVTVLRQLRSMVKLPPDLYETVGEHVNAHMLATAGFRRSPADVENEITLWLEQFANDRMGIRSPFT